MFFQVQTTVTYGGSCRVNGDGAPGFFLTHIFTVLGPQNSFFDH